MQTGISSNRIGFSMLFTVLLCCMSLLLPGFSVLAETYTGMADSNVTFTQDEKLVSTFSDDVIDDTIAEYLEPGDTAVFTVTLKNEHSDETDWWMDRRTLDSLELWGSESASSGGGFRYELLYQGADGSSRSLYSSLSIAGENLTANQEAKIRTKTVKDTDFIYLDTLSKGQSGMLTLRVLLDGESQGNAYQTIHANVAMDFAVELKTAKGTSLVMTGDDMNALPFFASLLAAGGVLLALGIIAARKKKQNRRAA